MLCVSVVYLILPWNTILQLVFEEKFNLKEVKYMDCISKLGNTYEIVDPVQRHIELEGYFNRINKERVKRGGMIYEIDQ